MTDPHLKRLSALQLRIRAARLQASSLERYSSFDHDIDQLVQEARVKLEMAEEWSSIKLAQGIREAA